MNDRLTSEDALNGRCRECGSWCVGRRRGRRRRYTWLCRHHDR